MSTYLTLREVAGRYGVRPRTVQIYVAQRLIPALWIGRAIRVESVALGDGPELALPGRALTAAELAQIWRVERKTILRLIQRGSLGATRRGTGNGARYQIPPSAICRYITDHTTGPDEATS